MAKTRDIIEAASPGRWSLCCGHALHDKGERYVWAPAPYKSRVAIIDDHHDNPAQMYNAIFIAHFDPTHVSAMEDVYEAAQWLANDRPCMPIEQRLMMPASVNAVIAAKARLDELRG